MKIQKIILCAAIIAAVGMIMTGSVSATYLPNYSTSDMGPIIIDTLAKIVVATHPEITGLVSLAVLAVMMWLIAAVIAGFVGIFAYKKYIRQAQRA